MADVAAGGSPDQGPPTDPAGLPAWPSGAPADGAVATGDLGVTPDSAANAGPYSGVPTAHGGTDAASGGTDAASGGTVVGRTTGRGPGWRRWLWLAAVIGFVAACAVGMLLFLGFNIGLTGLLVGLAAAILPVPLLVGCFLWLDRYEPEPVRYLLFCFGWGAFVSTAAALTVNTYSSSLFERWGLPEALVAVLVAPFIEESTKALGPLLLLWRRRREWSGITDGIVYCGLSAVGFAMVENILYLGGHGYAQGADQYGPATGTQNVLAIFIVRILFTGFAHPLFTSMSGVGMGVAARAADRRVVWLAPAAGLLLAMMLHGTWNLMPTLAVATGQRLILVYGYIGVMVPIFFAMVGLAVGLRGWEGRLSERVLPQYVRAGWFTPPELAALGSLGRRHSARQWARRVSGASGAKAMRGFQFAATQLALLRDGMQRGLHRRPRDVQRAAAEEQRLLEAISRYRAVFVGRDPQMPPAFWNGRGYRITFPDGVPRDVAAPDEPVVPVPIAMSAAPAYGGSPYGGSPYGSGRPAGSPHGGQPYYANPGSYGTQPGYGPRVGYSGSPGYGPAPGNGGTPGYGAPGGQPSYGGTPTYGPTPGNGPSPYGSTPGYGPSTDGPTPPYGPSPYGPSPYGPTPYGSTPQYGSPAGYDAAHGSGWSSGDGYGAPAYQPPGAPAVGNPDAPAEHRYPYDYGGGYDYDTAPAGEGDDEPTRREPPPA